MRLTNGVPFGGSQNFVHAGGSLEYLAESIHTQGQHPVLEG